MRTNGARWLFILACALALAAVVQSFRFDASSRQGEAAVRRVDHDLGLLRTALADLRGGQTAYLATGQGPEFWMRRVTDLATQLDSGLSRLRNEVESPDARTQLANAATALTDLLVIDKRARQAIESDQRFLASDIVFAEGLNATQTMLDALAAAGEAESAAVDARLLRDSRIRLALMPVALLVLAIAGLVWGQAPRQPAASSEAASMAQMLRDLPPPVKAPGVPAVAAVPRTVAATTPPASVIDLHAAAELCVDLARVMDAEDVPTLLSRAARTLDASGVVVWVVTASGDRLLPMLSHGYAANVIARLGSLDVTADNMTSVCFRTVRPLSVPGVGHPGATSAIAVPLVTSQGCNGVMAAELPIAKPPVEALAMARIIAAQFATMITPYEAEDGARAAEA